MVDGMQQMPTIAYIGLGSNLGDSQQIMQQAIAALSEHAVISDIQVSGLYASKPLGPQDQPDFLNAAVSLKTTLSAFELLAVIQGLEKTAGRVKLRHWGERTLDMDLLLYGHESIHTATLTVPHPGILQRHFVMLPLLDLNPHLCVAGLSLQQQLSTLTLDDIKKVSETAGWNAEVTQPVIPQVQSD